MRTLVIEVTVDTPDGNPWPLVSVFEVDAESDAQYAIADGVRVPCLGPRLDTAVARTFHLWRAFGPLGAQQFLEAVSAAQVAPRRRR